MTKVPTDVRLVPAALAVWITAWVLTGSASDAAIHVMAACGLLLLVGLAWVVMILTFPKPRRNHRHGRFLAHALVVLACVLAVSVTVQVQRHGSSGLRHLTETGAQVTLTGRAGSDPQSARFGNGVRWSLAAESLCMDATSSDAARCSSTLGSVSVTSRGSGPLYGARVTVTGFLQPPTWNDGSVARLVTDGIMVLEPPHRLIAGTTAMRDSLATATVGMSGQARGLVPGIAVGDDSRLPADLSVAFRTTGLTHLTAVSGGHFAVVMTLLTLVAGALRAPPWARAVGIGVAACAFVLLVRPEPSVLRAAAMSGVTLIAVVLRRRAAAIPALAVTVIVLLIHAPGMARSFAFALSSAATAGLVLLTPPLVARLAPWIGKPLGFAVAVPISAQMACGPILVLFSPQVATTSVLANLLAAPAVAPATLLGLAAAVVSPWWMAGGTFLAWLASGATWWIATVASRCAALPGSALPWPSGPGGAAALAGLTAVVITLMLRCSPRDGWSLTTREAVAAWITAPKVYVSFARRRWQMGIASSRDHRIAVVVFATCAAVLVSAGGVGARAVSSARAPNLRWQVAFCDVGQGDAWAVRTGVNSAILVDAGPPEGNIRGCLTDLKITHLDLLVLTHFHADHVGGVGELLRAVSVDRAVVSAVRDPVSQSEATLGLLSGHNVPVGTIPHGKVDSVHRGPAQEGIEGGSAHAEGWSAEWTIVASSLSFPETATTTEAWNGGDSGNANDASLTVHVTSTSPYGTISVTGLGDLEEAGQAALVRTLRSRESRQATGKPLQPTENPPHGPRNTPQSHVVSRASGWRSDIVKVAHHGSAKQSSDLAALLSPIVAVFSVGASNTFGHPTDAALTLYHGTGAHNLRTDECGTLTFLASEGEGMLTNCGPDDAAPP